MKRFFIAFAVSTAMVCTCFASSQVTTLMNRIVIPLNVTFIQPNSPIEPVTPDMPPRPRTPIPELSYEEHVLYFITSCVGDTLQLVQDDDVVYSIIISEDEITLPTDLEGSYELQIIHENLCFYGEIEL